MDNKTFFDGYTPVSLEIMRLDRVPGFNLYIVGPSGLVLYREKNIKFTLKNLKALLENNVRHLYFANKEESKYYEYIEENLSTIIDDKKVPNNKKASLIYDASAHLAQQMFMEPDSRKIVKRASKVMDSVVSFTTKGENGYKDIIQMLPSDYYTHTHSANVATYSLAIGQELGMTQNTGVWELTLGALLHDIGKSKVPDTILNKRGSLTRQEFGIVKLTCPMGPGYSWRNRGRPA